MTKKENPFKVLNPGEAWDALIEYIKGRNNEYLEEFKCYLEQSNLSNKTIEKHLSNVDFYINTYLTREYETLEDWDLEDGCYSIDGFIRYYFIRKCMWSSPSTIKENIASFKKFYKFMLQKGCISKEAYDIMLETIKGEKDNWILACNKFDNGIIDYDELY